MNSLKPERVPEEDLKKGMLVHVEGWNFACVFRYVDTINGYHQLITPKTRRTYTTTNNLLYTRKHQYEQA